MSYLKDGTKVLHGMLMMAVMMVVGSLPLVGEEKGISSCSSGSCSPTSIKKVPYTISSPGIYCLTGDFCIIDEDDCPLCDVGITIESNNVVLNMNGFTLSQGQRGIVVVSGSSNIIIKNGFIIDSAADGIRIEKGCTDIEIINMTLVNCNNGNQCGGQGSIILGGTATDHIKNCILRCNSVEAGIGVGIGLVNTDYCKVVECCVVGSKSSPQLDAVGFFTSGISDFFQACSAIGMTASHTGTNAFGFFAQAAREAVFTDCQAFNMFATALSNRRAYGFYVVSGECVVIEKSLSNHNITALTAVGGQGAGFVSQNSIGTIITDCCASDNQANDDSGFGFQLICDVGSCITQSAALANVGDGFATTFSCQNCLVGTSQALGNTNLGFELTGPVPGPIPDAVTLFYSNFAARNGTPAGTPNNYSADVINTSPVQLSGSMPTLPGYNIEGD